MSVNLCCRDVIRDDCLIPLLRDTSRDGCKNSLCRDTDRYTRSNDNRYMIVDVSTEAMQAQDSNYGCM